MLKEAIISVNSFGTDYDAMSEEQQYQLGAYLNLMQSSTQLLVNPIKGLLPKFDDEQWNKYFSWENRKSEDAVCKNHKELIISLSNFLYKIKLDDKDKKLLLNTFRKNKKLLEAINMNKKEFTADIIDTVEEALAYLYN